MLDWFPPTSFHWINQGAMGLNKYFFLNPKLWSWSMFSSELEMFYIITVHLILTFCNSFTKIGKGSSISEINFTHIYSPRNSTTVITVLLRKTVVWVTPFYPVFPQRPQVFGLLVPKVETPRDLKKVSNKHFRHLLRPSCSYCHEKIAVYFTVVCDWVFTLTT